MSGQSDFADLATRDPASSLKIYAVNVLRVPRESWTGLGVYLGKGLVLTAAHVVSRRFWVTNEVEIAGRVLPARVIKQGSFSDVDLALLSIDDEALPVSLRLRRVGLCRNPVTAGEEIISATPAKIARSHIVEPASLPENLDAKFRTAMADVASTGASGSGVFDASQKCLLGIVSGKIFQSSGPQAGPRTKLPRDIAKFFVPASAIAGFMPTEYREILR